MKQFISKHLLWFGVALIGVVIGASWLSIGRTAAKQLPGNAITEERLKEIVIAYTGETDLTFETITAVERPGKSHAVYQVKAVKDQVVHYVDVDPVTGDVLSYQFENAANVQQSPQVVTKKPADGTVLDEAAVKKIVAENAKDIPLVNTKVSLQTGTDNVYDVIGFANDLQYQYTVDGVTGKILSSSSRSVVINSVQGTAPQDVLAVDTVKEKVHGLLARQDVTFTKIELETDTDDAQRYVYDVDVFVDGTEYDVDFDARTGEVLRTTAVRQDLPTSSQQEQPASPPQDPAPTAPPAAPQEPAPSYGDDDDDNNDDYDDDTDD